MHKLIKVAKADDLASGVVSAFERELRDRYHDPDEYGEWGATFAWNDIEDATDKFRVLAELVLSQLIEEADDAGN